jgi:hypothetical protein
MTGVMHTFRRKVQEGWNNAAPADGFGDGAPDEPLAEAVRREKAKHDFDSADRAWVHSREALAAYIHERQCDIGTLSVDGRDIDDILRAIERREMVEEPTS